MRITFAFLLTQMVISQVQASKPPNVLVLFADDMGINQLHIPDKPYAYTGVSGAITTPHLAQFASEGTTFMQWYSAFHVCTPSRGLSFPLPANDACFYS